MFSNFVLTINLPYTKSLKVGIQYNKFPVLNGIFKRKSPNILGERIKLAN